MTVWIGSFQDWGSISNEFWPYHHPGQEAVPEPAEILIAEYDQDGYEGDATVIFKDVEGNLKMVQGGHCSCYGLEEQWNEEDTTKEALLKMAEDATYGFFQRNKETLKEVLGE